SSAPTPCGPPVLCPVTVNALTPLAAKSTSTCPNACTASVCTGIPNSLHTSASSATGLTVPTSLLAHMTLTSATLSGSTSTAARSWSGPSAPGWSTSSQVTSAPACSPIHSTVSSTA